MFCDRIVFFPLLVYRKIEDLIYSSSDKIFVHLVLFYKIKLFILDEVIYLYGQFVLYLVYMIRRPFIYMFLWIKVSAKYVNVDSVLRCFVKTFF